MWVFTLGMRLCGLALLVYLSALNVASAAPGPSPGEQDLIRERQDRLLEEQRKRLDDLQELPGKQRLPSAPTAPAETRCFNIQHIDIKGADHLSEADRQQLTRPFLGKCLGVGQLNELLKVITDLYLDRGMVTTRAYLPQQDLSSGNLSILVVEGKLEGLKADDGSGLSARELAMSFPGSEGNLLNLREIEQMVDQLNRLPNNHAQMELTPGKEVGGSQVLVKNTPSAPWQASLSRNNNGQRSTGEQQASVGLEWNSPLGLSDQLMLRGGHDVVSDHTRTSKNAFLNYNLPWGWWNFSYSYSQSDYRSEAQANAFSFKQNGDSENHQLRAERVIYRDAVSKTSLNVGLAYLNSNNYIEDSRIDVSSNRLSEAQFGINHGRRIGSAFINIDLGIQHGVGAFGAQGDDRTSGSQPDARYQKYTGTLSYLQPFKLWDESLSFSSLMTGQHSEDVLFSPQRMSLGGLSSIRGYKDQTLSGDSGGYWRNDLRWSRPVAWGWLRPVLAEYGTSLGYDQGVISRDRYNGAEHGRVSSDSVELFAKGQHLSASVTFAHSLERPGALSEHETPIYFQMDFFL
ncbi:MULTISPECIES: ShlB/FhaC/HecB family hemolysin secretion/activation protein [unclassified Pseudomonas]|uniref:ShlB/FhaC/HecB family hemolysin secretion/activation protein n=1 Tax=unclassified Pseudomonas TaxID=196821 RepID=UPI002B23AD5C|nr:MULTISPECIES: ShlB/FhaC/HecB family hemolysin secretion/activation protein [unclassified Pseudomonas]MEA9976443.1 ShlB/FhaC/HecB family hemolysin secretion/activation protein [Pseudomonas sp. RTS4]MEB0199527.1 ShlB/FhaC/HecB family hemolysin secretion/activation protein [Pseudomonas sp. 5S4]MEB0243996.1 ShlB/FhaC/HecB family hemolysin secretion/activation protein [Pseudomonas sp. 10S5]